ncbi:Signal transduction histidine kinase [Hahella chejuensis KCTC 2396]|uniref:histidine kinase n=1 Tax=Hahella chejuensis (strain KCTC 2396) TaxID=349521 RepID=Q2SK17_HAHCH|nr:CHASE domain-containing protein [Hahella chejuensis]ABC29007.1 Signal transduction histidine kinase [Hahella chejuensis KCTC 2396]
MAKSHAVGTLLYNLLTALAYFATGRMGLWLTTDSTYVTAIWIPSGIALAAVLLGGYRLCAGVFLGSLVNNLSVTQGFPDAEIWPWQLFTFVAIAAGAALQASLGRYLVIRFANYPGPLAELPEIIRFLFFAGPASCLSNAVIGCSSLLLAGFIPVENYARSLGVWWIGDTIGVVVFTPLILVWGLQPRELWRKRRWAVTFSLLGTFFLATVAFLYAKSWEESSLRLRFFSEAQGYSAALNQSLEAHLDVARAIERNLPAGARIDRSSFEKAVFWALERYPGFQAMSWNPYLRSYEREAFEVGLQQDYGADMGVVIRRDGELRRSPEKPIYLPVRYIFPLEGNRRALGFDVSSNPSRLTAIADARESRKPVMTGPVHLVQHPLDNMGALVFYPHFLNGGRHIGSTPSPNQADEEGEDADYPEGFLVAVFRIHSLLKHFIDLLHMDGYHITLADVTEERFMMHEMTIDGGKITMSPTISEEEVSNRPYRWEHKFTVLNREWDLDIAPTRSNIAANTSINAWIVYVLGLLFTGVSGMVSLFFSGRTLALEALVSERTAELKHSEQRLRAIYEHTPDGMLTVTEEGNITAVNPAVENLFGYACSNLAGLNIRVLIPDYQASTVESSQESVALNTGPGYLQGLRRNGQDFPLELQTVCLSQTTPASYLCIVRDVTERAEAERIKDEFISTISHELRTPLTAINGSLALLDAKVAMAAPDKQAQMIGIARRNTDRLLNLVNAILDLKKMASGEMTLQLSHFNLAQLVSDVLALNQGLAHNADVSFSLQIPSDCVIVVEADEERLTQVLTNLISNAAKFSPPHTEIVVSVTLEDSIARVSVTDKGPGVPPEFLNRIFGRFAQADSSNTRNKSGTGLGLNISKAIIERHGGKIGFHNNPGGGCTFYFELPAHV